ncbi:MAG: type II toxin-antitoxin system PemK/MazF family toxin [Terracidiphilus sp.]|nr:type II toxin-antitoxin system PemK/MazF family toxin [Terracidiphilus sp.]
MRISIERGEVYWVNFDPGLGGEIKKTRPAIVLSNNAANTHLNRLQVVPITSNTERLYPGEAYVSLNTEKRKAMADQLTTVSKQRLGSRVGTLSKDDVGRVEDAVLLQLGIDRS